MIRRPPRSTRTAHSFPTRRSSDLRTVFYVENDPETPLTVRVKKHVLGTPVVDDELVYEEHDDSFYMGVDRTRDDRYICIGVESTVSSELRCAPAADPREFTVLAPRERDVEYDARSEERSVGKECVSKCRSRWSPNH